MSTLQLQMPAPDFTNPAVKGKDFSDLSLSSYRGRYVVLLFYPTDFVNMCQLEILEFSERIEEFKKLNCELLGVSCDSQYTHSAWMMTPRGQGGVQGLKFPLIADKCGKLAKTYGVYNEETGMPFRSTFIIDGQQILRQMTASDIVVGLSVNETLRLVRTFQSS